VRTLDHRVRPRPPLRREHLLRREPEGAGGSGPHQGLCPGGLRQFRDQRLFRSRRPYRPLPRPAHIRAPLARAEGQSLAEGIAQARRRGDGRDLQPANTRKDWLMAKTLTQGDIKAWAKIPGYWTPVRTTIARAAALAEQRFVRASGNRHAKCAA